jgi:hypothetical protein
MFQRSEKEAIDESKQKADQQIVYLKYHYPMDHWAVNPTKERTGIAFFIFRDKYRYIVKLNPTDRRGYRILVSYLGKMNEDIQNSFNRPYTLEEQIGLLEIITVIITIYKIIGIPLVQCEQAGNNAHSFDPQSKIVQIGNVDEPSTLHMHIFGRGDDREYIKDIPLNGPELGVRFDMRGGASNILGNCKKIKWESNLLSIALDVFKQTLLDYSHTEEFKNEFSSSLTMDIQHLNSPHSNPKLNISRQSDRIKMFNLSDLPVNHWTFHPRQGNFCIAFFTVYDQYQYVLQLNRHDRRGNRVLITYIGEKTQNIYSSFKFPYKTSEQRGLLIVAGLMTSVYKNMGFPIVQIVQGGNNAQAFDKQTCTIILGNKNEPHRLLLHVFARGNPQKKYDRFLPELKGPFPGKIFNTRADSHDDAGNEEKITWDPLSKLFTLNTLTCALAEYCLSDEFLREFSQKIVVNFDKKRTDENFNLKKSNLPVNAGIIKNKHFLLSCNWNKKAAMTCVSLGALYIGYSLFFKKSSLSSSLNSSSLSNNHLKNG